MIRTAQSLPNYNWDASQNIEPKGTHSELQLNQPSIWLAFPLKHGTQSHTDTHWFVLSSRWSVLWDYSALVLSFDLGPWHHYLRPSFAHVLSHISQLFHSFGIVINRVKRICLCSPFSKKPFTTFCNQSVGYLRFKRLTWREKWAGRPNNNESLWKEKTTAKRKTVDFLLAGLTLRGCLTYGTKGGELCRLIHQDQEREREWEWERKM